MKKQDKTCAIIIPIYEDDFNIITKTSFDSLLKNSSDYTKNNYPIILIGPKKLEKRIDELSNYLNRDFYVSSHLFDDRFFESTKSYSELLKSYEFYKSFEKYDYILIYQTDCIMIHDDLTEWINKDYDYIGGAILAKYAGWRQVPVVGNGGCSLRKMSYFLDVTNPKGKFLKKYKEQIENSKSVNGNGYEDFEDLYFAELIAYYYGMNRPHFKEALTFAFDMNPDIALNIKNSPGKLPSFLHAFDKNLRWYDKKTDIKKFIEDYESLYEACEEKHKELHETYMKDENDPKSYE